ncbi:hypothetical protein GCM10009606_48860 [Nocardioides aquiterrae]|uniref:M4 family peptidase n=1 Tax=Nocardioides aquiterrae TaxID=203799 RepID=A0ABN1UUI1_9ACTN
MVVAALAVVSLSACDAREHDLGGRPDQPTSLVLATGYTGDAAATAALQDAVEELRAETRSGWVGRQDDVTGMLAELSGGRYFAAAGSDSAAVVRGFLDEWGARLFGVTSTDLELGPEGPATAAGSTSVRATQQVGRVPVLDGELVFTVGDAAQEPRLNAVRGRAFAGLDVDPRPDLGRATAVRRAEAVSGGVAVGRPALVVVPGDAGHLAWQVTITQAARGATVAPSDGWYFIDAHSGTLVSVRPASAEGRTPVRLGGRASLGGPVLTARAVGRTRGLAPDPGSVEVTGTGPTGEQLTAHGVRLQDGVALVDTTVPTWDDSAQTGGIWTYDMGGSDDDSQLPGRLYVEPPQNGTAISDADAIAAHAFSRAVYDYYGSLGWSSWDGKGSDLISSVHYSDGSFCNSYFNFGQMVYGNPCAPDGKPAEVSELDVDTAGHEITHGVTDSSAGLIYSGQSGAMNESFSDYFGNVIGDRFQGSDSNAVMEHGCTGITPPTQLCHENPDGSVSTRYLLNGTSFDDYFFALDTVTAKLGRLGLTQDHGGVHINSAIWNNALWSIRSRLAQMDGTTALDSKLAGDFDKIVFAALTTQIGPTSGFVDARRAIEQTTVDAGADPVILRVEREVFDAQDICAGCGAPARVVGEIVSNAPETETQPAVHGDRVAWLSKSDGPFGAMATGGIGAKPSALDGSTSSAQVVFAGDALVGMEFPDNGPGAVARFDAGSTSRLGEADRVTAFAGLAGSDDGAAWATRSGVSYVDAAGSVTALPLSLADGDSVTALGAGDGTVGIGTASGRVLRWTPGGDAQDLGTMAGGVLSIAAYGDRVLALDEQGNAQLFSGDAAPVQISSAAMPFGAAMNDHYAVWSEAVGELGGGAAEEAQISLDDTDLYLVSFDTGTVYDLMDTRGQQGFPALSGDRLVWQDAVYGGDDILTATIPSGL